MYSISNLTIVHVESMDLFYKHIIATNIGGEKIAIPLLAGNIGDLSESLESMEKHAKSNYNYLFICKLTNRYGLAYSEEPFTHWSLEN